MGLNITASNIFVTSSIILEETQDAGTEVVA